MSSSSGGTREREKREWKLAEKNGIAFYFTIAAVLKHQFYS